MSQQRKRVVRVKHSLAPWQKLEQLSLAEETKSPSVSPSASSVSSISSADTPKSDTESREHATARHINRIKLEYPDWDIYIRTDQVKGGDPFVWVIRVKNKVLWRRWGLLRLPFKHGKKEFATEDKAEREKQRLIREKKRKGFSPMS